MNEFPNNTSQYTQFPSEYFRSNDCDCIKMDSIIASEHFRVMLQQESLPVYRISDYLAVAQSLYSVNSAPYHDSNDCIDFECRETMVEWSFQVADFAHLRRDTVAIAMNYLDRYLSRKILNAKNIMCCRKLFQLSAMSALFLAIKLNEKKSITAKMFAELSRGSYSASDIHLVEEEILKTLDWRVNGPTAQQFLCHIMLLCSEPLKLIKCSESFVNLCNYQLDLSVGDYWFTSLKPSALALATVLNSIDNNAADAHRAEIPTLIENISMATGIDPSSKDVLNAMARLRMLLQNNGTDIASNNCYQQNISRTLTKERDSSPTCVSRFSQA